MDQRSLKPTDLTWRREAIPEDKDALQCLLAGTGFFYSHEIEIAQELLQARLSQGAASGYEFLFAVCQGKLVGYGCFGSIPLTSQRFDIYWLAVDKAWQRQKIGCQLLSGMEEIIRETGGQIIFAETAGRPLYDPTRQFYLQQGYREVARIPDYYADHDDKVVYRKKLVITI